MNRCLYLATTVLAALLLGEALAHSTLVESTPAAGATLQEAPNAIELTFNSPIRLTALSLARTGEASQRLTGLPSGSHTHFSVSAPQLAPGSYVLTWSGVSADGHVGNGRIQFQIGQHQ